MTTGLVVENLPVGTAVRLLDTNQGSIQVFVRTLADGSAAAIVANLAALALLTPVVTGSEAYVVDQAETYRFEAGNTWKVGTSLVVANAANTGRWFRRSKSYVVQNFMLWINSFAGGVCGLSPGQQVASSTDEPPDIILQLPVVTGAIGQQDVNVDELGNLWFTVNQSGTSPITINKYLLKNILASAVIPTPDLTIAVPNLGVTSECGCSCFDRNGNLWTMNGTHGGAGQASFLKYGFKAYGSPGGVATTSVLLDPQTATTRMSNQQDFVFDAEGNIWGSCAFTGNAGGPNAGFFKVSASALATSSVAPIVPAIYWSGSNIGNQPALSGDVIAISPTGFIFTSNLQGNNIRAWSPTTATGNPAPAIVLTSATFNGPYGITFDGSGNLWVANGLDNRVMRIPRGQLGATGVVVPDVIFNQNSVDLTGKMTFCRNPDRSASQPSGLPLAP